MLRLIPITALAVTLLAAPAFTAPAYAATSTQASGHSAEPPDPCRPFRPHTHAYLVCRRAHPLNEGWEQDKLTHQQTGHARY